MAYDKKQLLIPMLPIVLLGGVGLLAAQAKFKYTNPWSPDTKFVIDEGGPVMVAEAVTGQPRAAVASSLHNFGVMNPLTEGVHAFVIRNQGDAPLRLFEGGTTCKCATADIEQAAVAPGDSTRVLVQFNTGRDRVYRQTATIRTNDPDNPELSLRVMGEVEVQVAAEPRAVNFGAVDPAGEPRIAKMLVYSRSRTQLTILGGQANLEGMTWRTIPASSQDLVKMKAKSGVWVELTVAPESLPQGNFIGLLTIQTEGVESDDSLTQEAVRIGVSGEVRGRLGIYGSTIDASGRITLGELDKGEGRMAKLLVKIRDRQTEVGEVRIETSPEFVQVVWSEKSAEQGLYVLEIEVPKSATVGDYSGPFAGSLTLDIEHPRLKPQRFKLEFDVLERR